VGGWVGVWCRGGGAMQYWVSRGRGVECDLGQVGVGEAREAGGVMMLGVGSCRAMKWVAINPASLHKPPVN
jgi:hypothetical protein